MNKSPSPSLRGKMPKAEGGAPDLKAYLVAGGGPPLCHSVTSPPARRGEGKWGAELFSGFLEVEGQGAADGECDAGGENSYEH